MAKITKKYLQALGVTNLQDTLAVYNPWWSGDTFNLAIPKFRREVFKRAIKHIEATHELALLINGPRRVGKTTLLNQIIRYLIEEKKVTASRILFFSLDDPVVQQLPSRDQGILFEMILEHWSSVIGTPLRSSEHILYCFLDEVQRLPRWELYLKRYIDLHYPIRFVISGSASHTIFRKSLESLLGRISDISLPPFTFREWVRYHYPQHQPLLEKISNVTVDMSDVIAVHNFLHQVRREISDQESLNLWNGYADRYVTMGGFPQLWTLGAIAERAEFVNTQFVTRVTLEDLRLVKEIRRPEIFHQFLRYAFARTGEEQNLEQLAALIHTTRVTLTQALPLLLQTELIRKVERYTGKPVRLRSTHAKLYVADPILTQAITKVSTSLAGEERGRIAETIVHNTIRLLSGVSDVSYFREPRGKMEIDFIVRIGSRIVPVEVCYRENIDRRHQDAIRQFIREQTKHCSFGILVTRHHVMTTETLMEIPLPIFLLLA